MPVVATMAIMVPIATPAVSTTVDTAHAAAGSPVYVADAATAAEVATPYGARPTSVETTAATEAAAAAVESAATAMETTTAAAVESTTTTAVCHRFERRHGNASQQHHCHRRR